ncbi:RNA polymerase sigma factor [Haloferula sp.]|uniref:RNA polymerase sigma factor n=1 Tax=Haloferula sp. TaxID=2497595 RepID=UPI003C777F1E
MKRGDEAAWREFHDRYYDDLRRVALSRGVSETEVADVIQRSYLRILKHMKLFTTESDLRAWACCLLRSEVVDSSRRNRRRVSMMERFKGWVSEKPAQWVGGDPLEGMAAADRALLERHYVEGWSQAELAAEAGVSVKAIESKMARLRRRARAFLETNEMTES